MIYKPEREDEEDYFPRLHLFANPHESRGGGGGELIEPQKRQSEL